MPVITSLRCPVEPRALRLSELGATGEVSGVLVVGWGG